MTVCQKKHESIDFIDRQQGGITCFTWSPNRYLQIRVLAAIMYMGKKRKLFQSVVATTSSNTLIKPYSVKLEEALQNTEPLVCPAGVSCGGITWRKAWPWRSPMCEIFTRQKPGRFYILIMVFSGRCSLFLLRKNFCRFSSQGRRALQWAPALPSWFGVG